MTVSPLLSNLVRIAAILSIASTVAACSTTRRHHRAENGEGAAKAPAVVAPTTQQELKHLPRGLLPDTKNAVHSAE